jgi:hypothetical protein
MTFLSNSSPPAGKQIDQQDHDCDDQQQVDKTSGYVKTKSQQPHNEQDYKDGPKHKHLQALQRTNCG